MWCENQLQWVNSKYLLTKVNRGSKHRQLVGNILYAIYDDHPKQ
jgi:hypothetical protein